ncbi:Diacetylchitobiose uptake system permease protein DasC [Leucobacter aridicollis]|uniref:carbohydrate ABC transporter permease n=1 Tax=Leucobacter aridicollis TaxID=283878 RepID=UPI000F271664|nr:N,N'-diacetylchitobiose transport system permease protein [Leucobacter aridicollis]RKQ89839.1 N,N'-diacetylchitobiose transport system permease protein [Mycolicibacterium mucogenicum 261Sha1.1M5]
MSQASLAGSAPRTTTMTAPVDIVSARGRLRTGKPWRIVLNIVGILLAVVWAFPVYWMVNSAMLPNVVLEKTTPTLLPFGGSFKNFQAVIADGSFFKALGISLSIAAIVVVVCLIFAFLAALAISRFRFKGRRSFVLAVLFIQMLPAEGMFIAQYKLMSNLGLLNSIIGVSIIYIAAVVPFTIWMLRGFVAGIPADLEEAAMVDGLSRTQAFLRITFPLLAPGLVASGIYAFLQAWNEFTVALVLLDADNKTLPLWLRGFIQQSASTAIDWGQVMAASTLVAVPVIIFFMFVQGRMTSGLVSGAVKG